MVLLNFTLATIGTNKPRLPFDGESPSRQVQIKSFYIDKYEVSNEDFKVFVDNTGYITDSELYGWSFVFKYTMLDIINNKFKDIKNKYSNNDDKSNKIDENKKQTFKKFKKKIMKNVGDAVVGVEWW